MQKERLFASVVFVMLAFFGLLNIHFYGLLAVVFLYLLALAIGLYAFCRGWIEW